jgi:hypothetical protein
LWSNWFCSAGQYPASLKNIQTKYPESVTEDPQWKSITMTNHPLMEEVVLDDHNAQMEIDRYTFRSPAHTQ